MRNLIMLETFKWVRNGTLVVLFLGLVTLGYVTVVSTYFLEDLIAFSSTDGIKIELPDPTFESVVASYISNFAQLGIILCVVLHSRAVVGSNARTNRVAQAVRSRWSYRIFLPKIINSTILCLLSVTLSYVMILFSIWTLFPDHSFNLCLDVLACVIVGVVFCLSFASFIGVWSGSMFWAAMVPILLVFGSSFMSSVTGGSLWCLPSSLLLPELILNGRESLWQYSTGIAAALSASLILVLLACVRRLHRSWVVNKS